MRKKMRKIKEIGMIYKLRDNLYATISKHKGSDINGNYIREITYINTETMKAYQRNIKGSFTEYDMLFYYKNEVEKDNYEKLVIRM